MMRFVLVLLVALTATPNVTLSADLAGLMERNIGAKKPKHCPKGLWCACGLSVFLKKLSLPPLPSYLALSAKKYGTPAHSITRNTIVVVKTRRHHVGVATGKKVCKKGMFHMISANHKNRVDQACYRLDRVLAKRNIRGLRG